MNSTPIDADRSGDDTPLEPAAMAALMHEQQQRARRSPARLVQGMLLAWGIAWVVGFLALWSGEQGGNPWFRLSGATPWIIFGTGIGLAVVTSIALGIRMGRGTRGPSQISGAMYGWAWSISMVAVWLFGTGLIAQGLPVAFVNLYYSGAFVLVAGVLYLAGAALSRSTAQFALGVTLLVIPVVATFIGAPHHFLVYGLAGGGVMLVFGVLIARSIIAVEPARGGAGERS